MICYSAGWRLSSGLSEMEKRWIGMQLQEGNASSPVDRLGQDAHQLGLCLDKHWHFIKFILGGRISDDCLYVSHERRGAGGWGQDPAPANDPRSEKKASGLEHVVEFKKHKQEKQLGQLFFYCVIGVFDRQRQNRYDRETSFFLFSYNLDHCQGCIQKGERTWAVLSLLSCTRCYPVMRLDW